jgi:HD superfamily phosphohydrolase
VFLLCRKFGATLQEQVAALLHDVSHTAFSHTGDIVFDHEGEDAYQDAIHEWYIKQTDLYPVLQQYGMEDVITDESKDQFTILEQDLPDLCADRLEYNLDVGLRERL